MRHLLTTGLDLRAFKDWDLLAPVDRTWVALRSIIQDAFERCLNATAPTVGHQGYAPALPYMLNNAFGVFGPTAEASDDESVDTIATQIAAATLQSQLTATTAANSSQRQEQGLRMHKSTILHGRFPPDPGHERCVSPDIRDAPNHRWWRQYVQPCPSRRHARLLCPSRWHAAAGAAALLQCRQTLRELECMLHVRLRRTRWPHQRNTPGPTQSGPRRLLHTSKRATIY